MLVELAAVAAGQLAAPKAVKPWIREEDYVQLVYSGQESASLIRVLVSPEGKPESCIVEWSSGNRRGDMLSCSLTMNRSRFTAPRDEAGRPAWGIFQEVVNFYVLDGRPSAFPMMKKPDLELIVQELPEKAETASVKVAVAVDREGTVKACAGEEDADERLASIACRQLGASWTSAPALGPGGSAIPYVATRRVSFRAE